LILLRDTDSPCLKSKDSIPVESYEKGVDKYQWEHNGRSIQERSFWNEKPIFVLVVWVY
jgi:hypothetical protein